jgi:hypothetical protein
MQQAEELKLFIATFNIGIMLILETHFTEKKVLKIPKYSIYDTNHSARTARGATAIIIKYSIKHHQLSNCNQNFLRTRNVTVEEKLGPLTTLNP